MTYTHLTQEERYQIAILVKANHDQSAIAKLMNRHKSSISRELRRNRGLRGYRPKQAHQLSLERMQACRNGPRVADQTWAVVEASLAKCGALSKSAVTSRPMSSPQSATRASISASTLTNKRGGTLHQTLRCQKARKKRYGGRQRRGTVPNQVSIDLRPGIVAERGRFGDWEADLVIGAGHKQALVTMNERTSRYSLIAHVPFKTAQAVSDAMITLLTPFAHCVHTLTTDNGEEFAQHEKVARALDVDFAMHRLNHRSRKCLGYKTPHEVFITQLQSHQQAVAL